MTKTPYTAATERRLRVIAFTAMTNDRNMSSNSRNERPRTKEVESVTCASNRF